MNKAPKEEFDAKETQDRFEAALKGAMRTPHKPLSEKPKAKKAKAKKNPGKVGPG